jgi:hypothetical protein
MADAPPEAPPPASHLPATKKIIEYKSYKEMPGELRKKERGKDKLEPRREDRYKQYLFLVRQGMPEHEAWRVSHMT